MAGLSTVAIGAGSALSGIGALAGADAAKKGADKASKTLGRAQRAIAGIDVPEIDEQRIALEELAVLGELDPEMLQALELEASALEGISTDPRLQQSQMAALAQLGEISEGGLTEGDLAAMELARRQVESDNRAREESIIQNLQQRGQGGAGAELAMRLASAQGAADRQGAAALEQTAMAQQRALQALADQASLSGQIRGQDFSEQERIAQARDAIAQFNMQNEQRVMDSNVGMRNTAAERNLMLEQEIANRNVGLRNQQEQYNKALLQQQFTNELSKGQAMSGIATTVAGQQQSAANQQAGLYAGAGNALGQVGLTLGAQDMANQNAMDIAKMKYGK